MSTMSRPVTGFLWSPEVRDSRDLARQVLTVLPLRWQHTVGVASRAAELADLLRLSADRDVLVAAAWLHDIGYAPPLVDTGFHPLDGAVYIDRHGWPMRLAALVAHHSGARFVAEAHGLDDALARYVAEESVVADALTYADQTVGPRGERLSLEERFRGVLRRHGPESPTAQVRDVREAWIREVARRVEARITGTPPAQRSR